MDSCSFVVACLSFQKGPVIMCQVLQEAVSGSAGITLYYLCDKKNEYNINVKQPADSVALGDVFIPLPLSFLLRWKLEQHRQGLRDVEGQR